MKALAAYRASLVSKGAGENEQKQQTQQPQQQIQYSGYTGYASNTAPGNVTYQVYSPQHQPSSPQQHQQQQQQQQQQMTVNKKSPHHLAMQGNPQQQVWFSKYMIKFLKKIKHDEDKYNVIKTKKFSEIVI